MTSVGTVRTFDPDQGWGVIDAPNAPGGCWVHFSAIAMAGYRQLSVGQRVSFRGEPADQDGFAFRAVQVWPDGAAPAAEDPGATRSAAYSSTLNLTFDAPRGPV